jgi:hypothetical protein
VPSAGPTVAVVTTNSLARSGGLAETLRSILGPKVHSVVAGIHSHTPRADVVRVIEALPLLASNPRPIMSLTDVMLLLKWAW